MTLNNTEVPGLKIKVKEVVSLPQIKKVPPFASINIIDVNDSDQDEKSDRDGKVTYNSPVGSEKNI